MGSVYLFGGGLEGGLAFGMGVAGVDGVGLGLGGWHCWGWLVL